MEKIEKIIAESVLFSGLSGDELEKVAGIALLKNFGRGESIFFEGDEGNGFYMVLEGRVKIFKMSLEGKEQILHIFGPGEPFGEVPVFHGGDAELFIVSAALVVDHGVAVKAGRDEWRDARL